VVQNIGADVRAVFPNDGAKFFINLHATEQFKILTEGFKNCPVQIRTEVNVFHATIRESQAHTKPFQRFY